MCSQPTGSPEIRYHLYVYFKCTPEKTQRLLELEQRLATVLLATGHRPARLLHRPFTENPSAATQTWMEVYDEVDADFCTWLEGLAEVGEIAGLSLQGRHTELFVSTTALNTQA